MTELSSLKTLLLAGGAQKPSLDLNFLLGALPPNANFTRSGATATYFDATGTLQNATANVPRFDHSPTSPYAPLGILLEQASTNLIPNNNSFSTSTITVGNGQTYTLSFYGTGTIAYTGAATGSLVGTGAFPTRVSQQITTTTTSLVLTPTGTVQYAQLENLSFATSPIPTSGSAVTRNADSLIIPVNVGINSPFAAVVEFSLETTSIYQVVFEMRSSDLGTFANITAVPGTGMYGTFASPTHSETLAGYPTIAAGVFYKAGYNFDGSANVTTVANGIAAGSTTASQTSAPFLNLLIGSAYMGNQIMSGHISRFRLWPRSMSASELAGYTRQ